MSVLSSLSLLGQQRCDIPFLRQLDSSVCADFDVLGGQILTTDTPVIITGFTISTSPSPLGSPANQLFLNTAGGTMVHPLASESGSFLTIPTNQPLDILNNLANPNVYGTFSPGSANIVGLDYFRTASSTTNNLASFIPANAVPNSTTNQEIQQIVPFARTLGYRIIISNSLFGNASNVCPVAIVTTDSNNNVVSIEDARPLMFRLGSGSDAPNPYNVYTWPQTRVEDPITFSSSSLYNPFTGGDKSIQSFKDWCDAIMQRLQETAGGQYWYSPVSNWSTMKLLFGNFVTITANFVQTPSVSNVLLQWSGLMVACDNADLSGIGGPTQLTLFDIVDNTAGVTLNAGQCLYVDVDRSLTTGTLTAVVGTLDNLGLPPPPKTRFIIAWATVIGSDVNAFFRDSPYAIGTPTSIATTTTYGVVELDSAAGFTSWGGTRAVVVNGNGSGLAIATGISRGDGINPPYYTPGALNVGTQAQDTSVHVGSFTTGVYVLGSPLSLNATFSSGSPLTTIGSVNGGAGLGAIEVFGTLIEIAGGTQTTTPTIHIGTATAGGGTIGIGNSLSNLSLLGDVIGIGTTASPGTTITVGNNSSSATTNILGNINLGDFGGSADSTAVVAQTAALQIGLGTNGYDTHVVDKNPIGATLTPGVAFAFAIAHTTCTDFSGVVTCENTSSPISVPANANVALATVAFSRSYANPPVVLVSFYDPLAVTPACLTGATYQIVAAGVNSSQFTVYLENTSATTGTISGSGTIYFSYIVIGR